MFYVLQNESVAARRRVPILLTDAATGTTAQAGVALTSIYAYVNSNGGSFSGGAGTVANSGFGQYYYELHPDEIDTLGLAGIHVTALACRDYDSIVQVAALDFYSAAVGITAGSVWNYVLSNSDTAETNLVNASAGGGATAYAIAQEVWNTDLTAYNDGTYSGGMLNLTWAEVDNNLDASVSGVPAAVWNQDMTPFVGLTNSAGDYLYQLGTGATGYPSGGSGLSAYDVWNFVLSDSNTAEVDLVAAAAGSGLSAYDVWDFTITGFGSTNSAAVYVTDTNFTVGNISTYISTQTPLDVWTYAGIEGRTITGGAVSSVLDPVTFSSSQYSAIASSVWNAGTRTITGGIADTVTSVTNDVNVSTASMSGIANSVWSTLTAPYTTHATFGHNVLRSDNAATIGEVTLHQSGGSKRVDADVHAFVNNTASATAMLNILTGIGASITSNITGNLSGSVGSVTGNVSGNVVGSVASVTGNVSGNVVGSVASVTGNVVGSVGSVTGNVAGSVNSVVSGVTVTTNNDKTGYALSANQTFNVTGNVSGNILGTVNSVTGNVGGNVLGSVGSVTGNVSGNVVGSVGSVTGNVSGNVVGSVGSVTGNVAGTVGAVTGNVSGNVVGSVASVTNPVTFSSAQYASIASSVWNAGTRTLTSGGSGISAYEVWNFVLSDSNTAEVDLVQAAAGAGLTAGDVWTYNTRTITGGIADTVTSLTNGVTVTTNNDKTGYALSGAGVSAVQSGLSTLTSAQVGTEVDSSLLDVGLTSTVTGRIDATVSSRLPTSSYVTPPTEAAIAGTVWSYATRTLTSGAGVTAGDVWTYPTRSLTSGAGITVNAATNIINGPYFVKSNVDSQDGNLDVITGMVQDIQLTVTDAFGNPFDTTALGLAVNLYNQAGTLTTSYATTQLYGPAGLVQFTLDTAVTAVEGRYNLILSAAGAGNTIKFGPLQTLVRPF